MGLDDFMDLGVEPEEPDDSESTDDDEAQKPDYKYDGDDELVEVSIEQVRETLAQTEYNFRRTPTPMDGATFQAESPGGKWLLTVDTAVKTGTTKEHGNFRDALLVVIRDADTGYNVIEPYPVYRTDSWSTDLKQTIQTVTENKDELVFCDKCGGVRIIRETNTTGERIRGCSNYPQCRNSDKL